MRGYLLDTNIVAYWFDEERAEHGKVLDHISRLPEGAPIRISVVTLAEIEYGHRAVSPTDTPLQVQHRQLIDERFPKPLEIGKATTLYYGAWRARLFEQLTLKGKKKMARWPEQLVDPVTSRELGIQENDLWIAAQAMEHNLVLVTHDLGSTAPLRKVMDDELRVEFEDWAA